MQPSSFAKPSSGTPSFAGMLAEFAAPEKKRPPARDLDGLEDDIATISYEQALRAHARVQPQTPVIAEKIPLLAAALANTSSLAAAALAEKRSAGSGLAACAQGELFASSPAEGASAQADRKAASIT